MNVVATQATRAEQGLSYEQSNNSDRAAIRGWRFQWDMNEVFGGLGEPPSAPAPLQNIGNRETPLRHQPDKALGIVFSTPSNTSNPTGF